VCACVRVRVPQFLTHLWLNKCGVPEAGGRALATALGKGNMRLLVLGGFQMGVSALAAISQSAVKSRGRIVLGGWHVQLSLPRAVRRATAPTVIVRRWLYSCILACCRLTSDVILTSLYL
jgi:hypothetical protein